MWDKQEARWNAERDARNRLVNEVLLELRQQIEDRLRLNLEEQGRLLREREALLGEVEAANRQLKAEKEDEAKAKEERKKEQDRELAEKQMTTVEALRTKHLETQKNILLEKQKEEKILQELRKMERIGYQPQVRTMSITQLHISLL